ncbi:hypothetical protein CVT26_005654 [Gymnopilus dilepis]|uniref:Uncharacterized protein n=1 Tax=Gymnopilus dilepis TaxID=231916 RepID=A0A409XZT9_9AGAR|nr:hypothetical protein CVT26_005654 [Gymnopilus dilepis]
MNLATILDDPSALKATGSGIPSFDEWIIIDGSHQRLPGRPPEFVMQLVRPQGSPHDPILEITCFLDPLWGYIVELIEFTLLESEKAGEKTTTKVEVISRVRWKDVTSLAPGVMALRSPLIEVPRLEFIQIEDDYRLQDFVRTRHL